ncbi:hypothetical protein [Clostridium tertium]|uniref:O-Antigen ligase n=1 Tax=Clostridium tertium TaxID=1559 RepID=A0A6N2ZLK8_9CLOT
MEITMTAYLLIPYFVIILFKKIDFIFYNLVFFSAFTSVSIFNLGRASSITAYQIISLILFLKFSFLVLTKRINFKVKIRKSLLVFVIICGLSILLIPYKSKFIVLSPNDIYENVRFSIQNITQYCYLIISYIVYFITYILFSNNIINIKKTFKILGISFVCVLTLGIFQLIIPTNEFNLIFRNAVYVNDQYFLGRPRLASVNAEASILALFITPIIAMYLTIFRANIKIKYLILALLGIIIGIVSNSSGFYLGIFIYLLADIVLLKRKKNGKIAIKKIIVYYITVVIFIIGVFLFRDLITEGIVSLFDKITGKHVSGVGRGNAFINQMQVFSQNLIFGIGFGTTKSYDLFSTWLVQVGILGFSMYFAYILKSIIILKKKNPSLMMLILITNVVLLVSVSNFTYNYIWIYYGLADYIIFSKDIIKQQN